MQNTTTDNDIDNTPTHRARNSNKAGIEFFLQGNAATQTMLDGPTIYPVVGYACLQKISWQSCYSNAGILRSHPPNYAFDF